MTEDRNMNENTSGAIPSTVRLGCAIMDALDYPAMVINRDREVLLANSAARNMGVKEGTNCWHTFGQLASIPEEDRRYFEEHHTAPACGTHCYFCLADDALNQNIAMNRDVEATGRTYDTHWRPLGNDTFLHYAIDVTEKKKVA